MYTKHRLKLPSQTTLTNDGGLKNLDTRGDGGRIGEIVLHVGGNAVAAEGVLRHVHPLGDSPRRGFIEMAYRLIEYMLFLGIRTLFDRVTRGYGDHSPLTRPKEEVTRGGRGR